MNYSLFISILLLLFTMAGSPESWAAGTVPVWRRFEQSFTSSKTYGNPLYNVERFAVRFTSPTGRIKNINGFWDGGTGWKVRFMPDEQGEWSFLTSCSDTANTGLHGQSGSFTCTAPEGKLPVYTRGSITHPKGSYHLSHADGTPFFWTACTAWNGALLAAEEEWKTYLEDRARTGYSVIHFITTQWRGADKDLNGQVAFQGSGRITLNVDFFRRLDRKTDMVNAVGLVAAPVLLWALPAPQGRELSPGYYLPDQEAIKLARYMVARYGGNHVIWTLGGDGKYTDEFEQRWRTIGRGVFGDEHPGIVTTHPQGSSWVGRIYASEDWLDLIGYQSGHNKGEKVVNWINKGPMAQEWDKLPPRPIINMEPSYEQINDGSITDKDVRNASYWSLFATPVAGITYGASGIWPWLKEGEQALNHRPVKGVYGWQRSLSLPGSRQIGYLSAFMQKLPWWTLKPAPDLLAEQPGDKVYNHFISVAQSGDGKTILAYVPVKSTVKLYNPFNRSFQAQWFDPAANTLHKDSLVTKAGLMEITPPGEQDYVLVLQSK